MKSKSNYLILFLLFSGSFLLYSYNLADQPWHGDEITYLGWGGNYVQILARGDLGNPCLVSLDNCTSLFHIPAFALTYSPLRNIIIGAPMYLSNQDGGNFYDWSCYWDCYDHRYGPTIQEMEAGRFLSPIFGSLSVVILFLIGKMLFNKTVGILSALLFLFYDLWVWYSRAIMVEVHYVFFLLVSVLLLICALKTERARLAYLVPSALIFGIALNSKMLAVTFSGLFFAMVAFQHVSSKGGMARRENVGRRLLYLPAFFALALLGLFLVEPGFYHDPVNEVMLMKKDMDNYNRDVWYIGYPSIHNITPASVASLFHFSLFPSFVEGVFGSHSGSTTEGLEWTYPPTYSSVPLTSFFFAGMGYAVYRTVKSKNWVSNDALLVIWFSSTLLLTLVMTKDFSLERYLLPLELSVIVTAAYGLWNFTKRISNKTVQIVFSAFFVIVHSITALSSWDKIYFSPGTMWVNPLHYGTMQASLANPVILCANAVFIVSALVLGTIGTKKQSILKVGP